MEIGFKGYEEYITEHPKSQQLYHKLNLDAILDQALDRLGVPTDIYGGGDPYPWLKQLIRESKPCIILLQKGLKAYHWVVVVGYDNRNRFLIADPNGHFKWWEKAKLDKYWGFRNASGSGIEGDFINSTIRTVASPYTLIVPKYPPTEHWEPLWSEMRDTQVTGGHRWNPLFKTEGWTRTFSFSNRPDYCKATGVKPAQIGSAGGTAQAWVSGCKIEGNQVKAWGRVEYGKVPRGKLWVIVRAYRKQPF